MKTLNKRSMFCNNLKRPKVAAAIWQILRFVARLPVFMLLVILEPVVVFVFGALALAGILTTIFFVLLHAPHFPFWTMLAISLCFGIALMAYQALLRTFSV